MVQATLMRPIPGMPIQKGDTIIFYDDKVYSINSGPSHLISGHYSLIYQILKEIISGNATEDAEETFSILNHNYMETEEVRIEDMHLMDLQEMSEQLWEQYFAAPKKDKAPLLAKYNEVAELINKRRGFYACTILTDKTKDTNTTRPKREEPVPVPAAEATPKMNNVTVQIVELFKTGKTPKEIIAMGYNKSTVGVQIAKYKKSVGQ